MSIKGKNTKVREQYIQSFIEILSGEIPENVVWTADITYWIAGEKAAGRADPAWDTEEGYLKLHNELGVMPYYYYPKFWAGGPEYEGNVEIRTERNGNDTVIRINTPLGEVYQVETYLPSSVSVGCTRHFIQSGKDIEIFAYIIEHRKLKPSNLYDYKKRRKLWEQYGGYPSIALPRSPLASFVYEWAGIENATYLLMDYEEKITNILEQMREQEEIILDVVCETAPLLVHFPDNLTSDNFAGLYEKYMAGDHQRRIRKLHSAGIKTVVHLDGTIKGLLPKLVKSGFDAVEALTPAPVGDANVDVIKRLIGNEKTILWGGVPGAMFAYPYNWEEMKEHVQSVLQSWHGHPFILGVADQIPPDGDIGFCRKIAEMLLSP